MSVDEMPFLLEKLIEAIEGARVRLAETRGEAISFDDVQFALEELYDVVDQPGYLPGYRLSEDDIVAKLAAFPFSKFHPEVLGRVTLEESIVPEGTFGGMDEKTVKAGGEIWEIHKNDADPFPSAPHAHNYAAGLSLSLATGRLYHKRKNVGKVKEKHLQELLERAEIQSSSVRAHPDAS